MRLKEFKVARKRGALGGEGERETSGQTDRGKKRRRRARKTRTKVIDRGRGSEAAREREREGLYEKGKAPEWKEVKGKSVLARRRSFIWNCSPTPPAPPAYTC